MKVFFGQIYATQGISFPWTLEFQKWLSESVTALVSPTPTFLEKYGADWNLIFRISAKTKIPSSEIVGPSVFRRNKDVEFSVFLAFDQMPTGKAFGKPALEALLDAILRVFDRLGIDGSNLSQHKSELISQFQSQFGRFVAVPKGD